MTDEVEQIKKSFRSKGKSSFLKRAFIKGVAGILPALLTIIILVWCYQFLRNYVAVYVNTVTEWVVRGVGLEQEVLKINKAVADNISVHIAPADPDAFELQLRPVTGIILSLVLIYVVGSFISTFIGKKLFPKFERMFLRLPIVKAVYPYARQVTDFFLGEQAIRFESIVAVEYPRKGIYSVGFVTNEGIRAVCDKVNRRLLVVFIPSSPTPITGYTIMVRPEDTIPLDISIDDVLRMSISGGVILPENQRLPRGKTKPLQVGTVPPLRDAESGEDDNPKAR